MKPKTPRLGRPPTTSRADIVAAALRLLDSDGIEAFTMRRVSAEVGVSQMALYRHVGDRESLLALALDDVASGISSDGWSAEPRQRIVDAMSATYEILVDRAWVAHALIGPRRFGTGALCIGEAVLSAAHELGADDAAAMHTYRSTWSLTLGAVITTLRQRQELADDGAWLRERIADLPADSIPTFQRAARVSREPTSHRDFVVALRALVEGLWPRDG